MFVVEWMTNGRTVCAFGCFAMIAVVFAVAAVVVIVIAIIVVIFVVFVVVVGGGGGGEEGGFLEPHRFLLLDFIQSLEIIHYKYSSTSVTVSSECTHTDTVIQLV